MANDYLGYNNSEVSYNTQRNPLEKNVAQFIREHGQDAAQTTQDEEANISEVELLIQRALQSFNITASLTTISGYDASKNQHLVHESGTMKWVDIVG